MIILEPYLFQQNITEKTVTWLGGTTKYQNILFLAGQLPKILNMVPSRQLHVQS